MLRFQRPDSDALTELGELAVVVAHEIRNRLGSMMHAAQLLERKLPRDGEEHRLLRVLVSSGDQLEGIVNDLLVTAARGGRKRRSFHWRIWWMR